MYKMTADGITEWVNEPKAMLILQRQGASRDSALAILKTMHSMGSEFYRRPVL